MLATFPPSAEAGVMDVQAGALEGALEGPREHVVSVSALHCAARRSSEVRPERAASELGGCLSRRRTPQKAGTDARDVKNSIAPEALAARCKNAADFVEDAASLSMGDSQSIVVGARAGHFIIRRAQSEWIRIGQTPGDRPGVFSYLPLVSILGLELLTGQTSAHFPPTPQPLALGHRCHGTAITLTGRMA